MHNIVENDDTKESIIIVKINGVDVSVPLMRKIQTLYRNSKTS